MTLHKVRAAAAVAVLGVVALAGCSSSDSASTSSDTVSAINSDANTEATGGELTADTEVVDEDSGAGSDTGAGEYPDGGVTLSDGEADAAHTITFATDAFDPDSLEIKVGEKVTFRSATGTHAVKVGDLDAATISGGLYETFEFTEAGTYPVSEELTSATATITVS